MTKHQDPDPTDDAPSLGGEHRPQASGQEARLGGEAALTHLVTALHDPDWQVRERAAAALEDKSSNQAVDSLIEALHDENASVRVRAARGLGRFYDVRAVPALIADLDDASQEVRWAVSGTLGAIGKPALPALLATAMDENESREARQAAIGLLFRPTNQNDPTITPVLLDVAQTSDPHIRAAAIEWLGWHQEGAAIPLLLNALHGEDKWVASRAARALGFIGDETVISALLEATHDADLQEAALEALGRMKAAAAVPAQLAALGSDSASLRSTATKALGEIAHPAAVPALVERLRSDTYYGVRIGAAEALALFGGQGVLAELVEALNDSEYSVRSAIVKTLGKIADPVAVPALLERLRSDPNAVVRADAATILGKLRNRSALPDLVEALYDADIGVRDFAGRTLYDWADPAAIQGLAEALRTGSCDDTRWRAAEVLEAIVGAHPHSLDAIIPLLVDALHDPCSRVRWMVSRVLGPIRSPDAVPALIECLDDLEAPEPVEGFHFSRVCDEAADALRHIGSPEALAAVEAWKKRNTETKSGS